MLTGQGVPDERQPEYFDSFLVFESSKLIPHSPRLNYHCSQSIPTGIPDKAKLWLVRPKSNRGATGPAPG